MATTEGPFAGSVSASSESSSNQSSAASAGALNRAKWKGRILKRFKLVDLLGQGSMGKVFRAEDITLRRHVALKVLPTKDRTGQRDQKIDQFIREARSAASIEHPHTVTVYEIGEAAGVHYIAMELVEGGNLDKLIRASGPMEIERACQVIAEAAEALAAAHSQGIIHRDVKPSNLLLSRNGRCKLADFGLARFEDPEDLTVRGECVGTPCYIAPELPMGQAATPQSDIYSLGCTLWFLLTGAPPFQARHKTDMLKMHVYAALPDLREIRGDAPDRLVEAVNRACAKNPSERFDSADQFAKVLRTFTISTGSSSQLSTLGGSSQAWSPDGSAAASSTHLSPNLTHATSQFAQTPPMPPQPPGQIAEAGKSRHRIIWGGIGTAAAALLIGAGVWLARGDGSGAHPAGRNPPFANTTVVGDNVIRNGSLEESDAADGIAAWFVPPKYKHAISFETEDGNRFLRITNNDPGVTLFIDQKVPVDPTWKAVTISVKMRAIDFKAGEKGFQDARVALAFRDANDQRVGSWPPVPNVKSDSPWVERMVTCDVPADASYLYVQLALFNATGIVDFDDVKVIPQIVTTK